MSSDPKKSESLLLGGRGTSASRLRFEATTETTMGRYTGLVWEAEDPGSQKVSCHSRPGALELPPETEVASKTNERNERGILSVSLRR